MNIVPGILFAQHTVTITANYPETTQARLVLPFPITLLTLTTSLALASYPLNSPDNYLWSRTIHAILTPLTPSHEEPQIPLYVSNISATLFFSAVYFSPHARHALARSRCLNHLGHLSFAVYLLHDLLLRSAFAWCVYGRGAWAVLAAGAGGGWSLERERDREAVRVGADVSGWGVVVVVRGYLCAVYGAARVWTRVVDRWCEGVVGVVRGLQQGQQGQQGQREGGRGGV